MEVSRVGNAWRAQSAIVAKFPESAPPTPVNLKFSRPESGKPEGHLSAPQTISTGFCEPAQHLAGNKAIEHYLLT
jgi:hypothetical protein